jgi:tetratricopeptide (TPR) repeat protein
MKMKWMRIAAAGALLTAAACARDADVRMRPVAPLLGTPGAPSTSRDDLARTVASMQARLATNPFDGPAAVTLADALLRQTRVAGNGGLAATAEQSLLKVLSRDTEFYDARRMLASVYLSQHRFRDAQREAERCLAVHENDAWVQGVLGDAHLELGNYPEAFRAFDRMNARKPNAASYARASYARELQGDLDSAVRYMQMAREATGASDPESIAWHHAQLGHLYLEIGRLTDARREYAHADFTFPGHPFASEGLARVAAASGDHAAALEIVKTRLAAAPAPADFALAGDLLQALGRSDEAEQNYRLAETGWRSDVPEPTRLARFLAERGRRLDEAVQVAQATWTTRKDIFSADALAWAYFQTGRVDKARAAIAEATRTGTRDRIIRYHEAAIARALGHMDQAQRLVTQSLDRSPRFDLVAAPAAARLKRDLIERQVARR